MKLFEMEATLVLDTSKFETGATNAISKSGEIKSAIDNISTGNIDAEIAALDAEIAALDDEIASLELDNLDLEIEGYNKQISKLEGEIDSLDKRSSIIQGIYRGLAEAGRELLSKSLAFLFDFSADSLSLVEESGTVVGNTFAQAKSEMVATANVLKMKVGTELAIASTGLMNVAAQIVGITHEDKLRNMFAELESYKFQNLDNVSSTLDGIFSRFELIDLSDLNESQSVSDMNAGLQSQIEYWNEYSRVIQSLKSRGISSEMLATYADGSKESLSTLQSFEKASDAELEQMKTLFSGLTEARKGVATEISNAQLSVDASVDQMISSITQLAQDIEGVDTASAAAKMAQGIVTSLSAEYPSISSWTNRIIAKLAQLERSYQLTDRLQTPSNFTIYDEEIGPTPQVYDDSVSVGKRFAVGLNYVPYDDFPALLHKGERVLTKAEAEEWRKSPLPAGYEIDYDRLGLAVAAALGGVSVNMDGVAVGRLTAPTVSREIYNNTNARRYG